jgi:hypothetical protein
MLKYYRLRVLQAFSQGHNLKSSVILRLNRVSSMPAHPVQRVLSIHIGNKTGSRQRINKKTTFLLGTEYALDYSNKSSQHLRFCSFFCVSGIYPILKQQYAPLYCKGTTFMKWQRFANAFQQICYMASVFAQQRCFEYVTNTEVKKNMLWFQKFHSVWFTSRRCQ